MFSPYNLKYDAVRGMIIQALRNRDNEIWWELASAGARHAADIDIQHSRIRGYDSPRGWYEGGMYGHGYHDETGRTNPHRNYQNPVSYLAGPDASMFLWALLSGDTLVFNSAKELADNLYWRTVNSDYYADFYGELPLESRQCAINVGLQRCAVGDCYGYAPADTSRTGGNIVKSMLAAYLELISQIAAWGHCLEEFTGPNCDRYHFQTTFIRNLGHYVLFRERLGLPSDNIARDVGLIAELPIENQAMAPALNPMESHGEVNPVCSTEDELLAEAIERLETIPLNDEQKRVLEQIKAYGLHL